MKTLVVALLAAVSLGGCVVAPAYPDAGYYSPPGYYYGPTVGIYAAPSYGYYGRGYYGHRRHWR